MQADSPFFLLADDLCISDQRKRAHFGVRISEESLDFGWRQRFWEKAGAAKDIAADGWVVVAEGVVQAGQGFFGFVVGASASGTDGDIAGDGDYLAEIRRLFQESARSDAADVDIRVAQEPEHRYSGGRREHAVFG